MDDGFHHKQMFNTPMMGPDLGPNCLQRLSTDDTCRQVVKIDMVFFRKVNRLVKIHSSNHLHINHLKMSQSLNEVLTLSVNCRNYSKYFSLSHF